MGRIKKFFSSISKIITSINSGTSSSPNQLTNRLTLKDQEQIKTLIKNEALTESQIIEQQRQLEIKKKEIDQQILRIEKSTRTSIKQLNMLHNYLRQKYSWYYKWHLFKYSSQVHYAVLASFIAGSVAVSISFFYVANVPNTLASSASYLFSGITNPASATSNKVTVGYNQTPNSPGTEISSDSYGLISALDRSVYGYSESNKPDEMYRFYINNPSTLSSITSLAFSHTGFVRTGNDTQTITASNATANATVTVPTTALGAGGTITIHPGDSAATVQSALAAVPAIGSTSNVSVTTGGSTGGDYSYVPVWNGTVKKVSSSGDIVATISTGDNLADSVFGIDGSKVYVGSHSSCKLFVINTSDNSFVTITSWYGCGGGVMPFAASPDGTKIWVTVSTGGSNSYVEYLNTADNSVVSSAGDNYITSGQAQQGFVSADSSTVWITGNLDNYLSGYNTSTFAQTSHINLGRSGHGPSRQVGSNKAYVTEYGQHAVLSVNLITGSVTTIPLSDASYSGVVSNDGSTYYAPLNNSSIVDLINTSTDTVSDTTIHVGSGPRDSGIASDGTLYIGNEDDDTISIINTATNTVTATTASFGASLSNNILAVSPIVGGTFSGVYNITFQGALANASVGKLTATTTQPPSFDSSTRMLLHADGTNGTQTFTDTTTNHTVTANGSAQVDASISKWGQSLKTASSGDYLSVPASSDFDPTGDFTLDFWFNTTTTNVYSSIYGNTSSSGGGAVYMNNGSADGAITVYYGSAIVNFCTSGTNYADGVWHHFAFVRSGSNIYLFVDGIMKNSGTVGSGVNPGGTLNIARDNYYTSRAWYGNMDEIRVSNVARWTSNFTPPTQPYQPTPSWTTADTTTPDSRQAYIWNYSKQAFEALGSPDTATSSDSTDSVNFSGVAIPNYTVTNLNDSGAGSLRDAITSANSNSGSTIGFQSGLSGTITLASELPTISAPMTIDGSGASIVIDGANSYQIMHASGFSGSLTLNKLTFQNAYDTTEYAGALRTDSNIHPIITNSTFLNNSSPDGNGAIIAYSTATISNSTFSGNSANYSGGGAMNGDAGAIYLVGGGTGTITNSTFYNNTATNPDGGVAAGAITCAVNCSIINSTIVDNINNNNGAAVTAYEGPTVTILNSIVYGNSGSSNQVTTYLGGTVNATYSDIQGGYSGTGNISTDPALGALADNGGPTKTMAITSSSPAYEAGTASGAPSTDQRGAIRPATPSMGAYEVGSVPPASPFANYIDSNKYVYFKIQGATAGATLYTDQARLDVTYTTVPTAPTISSPANNATNISTNPTITSSSYSGYPTQTATSWKVYSNSDLADNHLVWSDPNDATHLTSVVINSTNGTFTNALSGQTALAQNTNYWVETSYSNSIGASGFSTPNKFTTFTPPPAPSNVAISQETINAAQTLTATNTSASAIITVPPTSLGAGGTITVNPGDSADTVKSKLASIPAIGSTNNVNVTGSNNVAATSNGISYWYNSYTPYSSGTPDTNGVLSDSIASTQLHVADSYHSGVVVMDLGAVRNVTAVEVSDTCQGNGTGHSLAVTGSNDPPSSVNISNLWGNNAVACEAQHMNYGDSWTVNFSARYVYASIYTGSDSYVNEFHVVADGVTYPQGPKAGSYAYVANYQGQGADAVDTSTNTVISAITGSHNNEHDKSIAVSPQTGYIYLPDSSNNVVRVYNPNSFDWYSGGFTQVATVSVGANPAAVTVSSTTGKVYVANFSSNTVSVIDPSSDTVTDTINVGSGPLGVAISPVNGYLYVANNSGGNVSVVNLSTNAVISTVTVGTNPYGLAVSSKTGKVYVPNSGSNNVSIIDPSNSNSVINVSVGTGPYGVAISPTTDVAYTANNGSGDVTTISPTDYSTSTISSVGSGPDAISVSPANGKIYVTNFNGNSLSVIDPNNENSVTTATLDDNVLFYQPLGIAFSPPATSSGTYTITFAGALANTAVPLMQTSSIGWSTADASSANFTASWTNNASNNTGNQVFVSTAANADCSLATYGSSPDYTADASATSQLVTGKLINTQYCIKVIATGSPVDSSPAYATPKYTLANIPSVPTVTQGTTGKLKIIINSGGNPSNTTLAINNATLSLFVKQADGTSQANPDWQTRATWGGNSGIDNIGLSGGTTYSYQIQAENGDGVTTDMSPSGSATTIASVPDAPTIGTATAGDSQATVVFTAPSNNGGTSITGYTVTSTPGSVTATGLSSPITVTGLNNGTSYTFTVHATNSAGNSTESASSNSVIVAMVPGAPTIGTATAGVGSASVAFTAPSNNGGSAITGYTVTSTPDSLTATGSSSPISITGLTNGTSYTFTVHTTNSVGNSSESGSSNSVTPVTIPGEPTIGTATSGNASASVTFTAPASNGGASITGYTVTSTPGSIAASGSSSPITISGLTNGTSYTFTIHATNTAGNSLESSSSNSVTPATVPGVPSIGSVTGGNAQVTVAFTAPSSNGGSLITSFTVTSTPGSITATGSSSPIAVTGLTNGTSYTFTVHATNSAGNSSESSSSSSVVPSTNSQAPTNLAATRGNAQASLTWNAPSSNGGSTINDYLVEYAVHQSGSWQTFSHSVSTNLGITVTGLTNGTSYDFRVSAVNGKGNSSPSDTASVTPATTPGTPTIGTVVSGRSQAIVSFTAPSNNGGDAITGYTVTSTPDSISASGSASPITVTGLTNGTRYTFTVHATNTIGNSSESSPSGGIVPATVPGAPTIGTATAGVGSASVAFTSPSNNGGDAITGYEVTSTPGSITASGTSSPITVPGLSSGTNYTFTVHATNSFGNSAESSSSNSVSPITVPGAPTIGTATSGNSQVDIAFTAPLNNGGSTVTGYTITSTPGSLTASGGSSPITLAGLTNGTSYTFTVHATNIAGNSAESSSTSAVIPATVPGTPTIGPATARNAEATVAFTTPSDNGGSSITGYTVTSTPDNITASGTTSPIIVPGLTNGTSYTFTVHATNSVGNSAESASSTPATPATVPSFPIIGTATAGYGSASVAFTAPSNNGGSAIFSYTVTSNPGNHSATGTSSPITVNNLDGGVSYRFSVYATNVIGNSDHSRPSNSVYIVSVPSTPTVGTAIAGNAQATVAFTAPISNGGSAITGYTAISNPGNIVASGSSSPITVTGLTNGTSYTFTVHATNTIGNSTESSASNSITPVTVPGAPTIGSVTGGDSQATVAFTAPSSNGGSSITSYTVISTPDAITATGATSPVAVTGLTNGTSYTFTVHATNDVGDGPESSSSNSVSPIGSSQAPTNLAATRGNSQVSLTWAAPSGSSTVTNYLVEFAVHQSGSWQTFSHSASTNLGATITGLTNGTSYDFRVSAISGGATGTASDIATATPATTPAVPTIGTATRGNSQATVTFTAPSSNGGSAITGYTVTSTPGSLTATGATSPIVVTSLANGTSYTFTVHATNDVGNSAESGSSNAILPITVPGVPTIGTASAGDAQATVAFVAPSSDGGASISSYTITSNPGNITASGSASPITVTGLSNGTSYTFTVHATNSVGASVESSPSNAVAPVASNETITNNPPVSNPSPVSTQITTPVTSITTTIKKASQAITSPDNKASTNAVSLGTTAVAVVSLPAVASAAATSAAQGLPWLPSIRIPFAGYVSKKRKKRFGLVTNALTYKPIAGVFVELLNKEGQQVTKTITDESGQYGFIIDHPGLFSLRIINPLYQGFESRPILITDPSGKLIDMNIALLPVGKPQDQVLMSRKQYVAISQYISYLHYPTMILGTVLSILVLLGSHSIWAIISMTFYSLLWAIEIHDLLAHAKTYGVVKDADTNQPLAFAVVQLIKSAHSNQPEVVRSTITDSKGRYVFVANKNNYSLAVAKEGYELAESKVATNNQNVDVALKKKVQTNANGVVAL